MRGEPFKRVGLTNVVESDVFSWFVANMSDEVLAQLREAATTLAEYDPATLQLSPITLATSSKTSTRGCCRSGSATPSASTSRQTGLRITL